MESVIEYDKEIKEALKRSNEEYIVWYTGSREQAEYISFYSKYLKDNSLLLPMPDFAAKGHSKIIPKALLEYFFLDFPDVIVCKRNELNKLPIIGIEILEQKPVGWNHTQRFARSAASAILGVPFAYLMPQKRYMYDKLKGNKSSKDYYVISGQKYKENLREEYQLPFSLYKLTEIFKIPCLPFIWPIKEENKFLSEGLIYNDSPELRWKQLPPGPTNRYDYKYKEIANMFSFIDLSIEYFNKGKNVKDMMNEEIVKSSLYKISPDTTTLYTKKHINLKVPDGGNIKIAYMLDTNEYIKKISEYEIEYIKQFFDSKISELFKNREKTLVIEIDSDPTKENRGFADPYSGVCASFDFRYCRNIRKSSLENDRDYNLVFAPRNPKSSKFFKGIIATEIGYSKNLDTESRKTFEETVEITEKLFQKGPSNLKKELKNIFYFCDLILTPGELFVGKSFIRK